MDSLLNRLLKRKTQWRRGLSKLRGIYSAVLKL